LLLIIKNGVYLIYKIFGIISFSLFYSLTVTGQDRIQISKLNSSIILDGKIDESAWESIEVLPMVQYEPTFNGEMHEETRIRIAYDENFIYVAGEMYTKDPKTMAVNSLYRDRYSSDDVFAIIIDGFNDDQNATWFFTNPAGVRFDVALSNDADFSGGRNSFNPSYNTFWDVATTQTKEGWFAEMRIPFSSIGIIVEDETAEIGFITYRWISAINERHIFPAIPPNWSLGNAKPSQAYDVKLEGVNSKNPIYFTPYGLGGYSSLSKLNADSSKYIYENDPKIELGFDLKYNVTSNLTLDVTVNTDFAQVEADDQQLNLSRFSLFFPEKRQFFQQRSSQFDFNFGGDRTFYSRRIGLDRSGNPVRILGGARLTGRVNKLDIGFLNLQTGENGNLPSENFGVLRLKNEVFNQRSFVGGILTSRLSVDGGSNIVYGLDTDVNIAGENFLEIRASQSQDDSLPQDLNETEALRFALRNSSSTGFNYQVIYNRIGENYNPGIGFVRISGTTDNQLSLGYGKLASEESIFQRHSFSLTLFSRNYNDEYEFLNYESGLQAKSSNLGWGGRFKQFGNLNITLTTGEEIIRTGDQFSLPGGIFIPEGSYSVKQMNVSYELSEAWKVAGNISSSFGELYDGDFFSFTASPRLFASKNLELGGSYNLTYLTFPETNGRSNTEFTTHLGQFRGQYAFNKKASVNMFLQYSNVSELIGANVRFRYNYSEGRDFWFVFNEQSYANRNPLQPNLPRLPYLQSRSVLLKYTHTFIY